MSTKDIADLRKLAGRRRAAATRLRRLLPTVVVGTTTLAGTGGLFAWMGNQPGLASTRSAAPAPVPSGGVRPELPALQKALQADEAQVRSLESALNPLAAQQAAAARSAAASARGGGGGTATASGLTGNGGGYGVSGGPAVSVAPIAPLPAIQPLTVAPAPSTNATTGASHAVP